MIGLVASLAVFGSFWPHNATQTTVERQHQKGWTLEIRHDAFAGVTQCRISGHDVELVHGVATFRFHHWVDTSHALFRIDDGPTVSSQTVAPEAAALGAALWTNDLSNPSDGQVHIPAARLDAAHAVTIRPNTRAGVRTFALAGLAELRASAKAHGCGAA